MRIAIKLGGYKLAIVIMYAQDTRTQAPSPNERAPQTWMVILTARDHHRRVLRKENYIELLKAQQNKCTNGVH